MPIEGRIAYIDISVILRRNVVVFLDRPISRTRIDFFRIGVAEIVEIEHLLQRVEHAVVEERAAYGGVAQGWRLEHAAKLRLVGKVGANRSTNPEIEILRVLVFAKRCVAWPTQGFILEIGKERRQSIASRLRNMAAAAIGFVWIIEQTIAAHFAVAEARLALEPIIELARVRVKARLLDLIAGDGEHRLGYQ